MAADDTQLVFLMEARIREFEKNMEKAQRTANKQFRRMESDVKKASVNMENSMTKMGAGISKVALRAFAPLLGVGALKMANDVAASVAKIGDEARKAGVGVEVFQEIQAVARAARIPIDAAADGLREMNMRAAEMAATGGGPANEALKALGYSATELSDKLKDPSALFTEIIGKLGKLDTASQLYLADQIFGGSAGAEFVRLIDQGEAGIRATIDQARNLGQVMDQEVITKAGELNDAFNTVATTVGTGLQQAIVNASWALFDFLQQFKAVEDRTTTSLETSMQDMGRKRIDLENKILQIKANIRSIGEDDPAMVLTMTDAIGVLTDEMEGLVAQEAAILKALEARSKPIAPPTASTVPLVPGGSGTGIDPAKVKAEADAVRDLIAQLEFERSLIGATALEQDIANALRHAGAAATEEQKGQITGLLTLIAAERAEIERTDQAMADFGQTAQDTLRTIVDGFLEGKDAGDIFGSVLKNIGSQLITMGIGGFSSGGGGILGSLFSGVTKREHGGPVRAGQPYIVGEKRPELFVPNRSGTIVPQVPSASPSGGGGSGGDTFSFAPVIDARGADQAVVDKLQKVVARQGAEFELRVQGIIRGRGKKWW